MVQRRQHHHRSRRWWPAQGHPLPTSRTEEGNHSSYFSLLPFLSFGSLQLSISLALSASFLPPLSFSLAQFPCICLSWARWTLHGPFSPSFCIYLAFSLLSFFVYFGIYNLENNCDYCEKYYETWKIILRPHAVNLRFFSLKLITSKCILDERPSCITSFNSWSF